MNAVGATFVSWLDLLTATGLVVAAGVFSALARAGVQGKMAVGAIRTVLQLTLIGYVLTWVFELERAWGVALVMAFMIVMAGRAAVARSERVIPRVHGGAIVSLALSGLITTWAVTAVVLDVEPWYEPRYAIALLGMTLGNALTGISLCLDDMLAAFSERRASVEVELALGATRWEAARRPLAEAVRRGMIPILNSMAVVGLVSLPGMMTGQILQGADPMQAVRYQIVVMFMIAAATAIGTTSSALFVVLRAFDDAHRLRSERIVHR